MAKYLAVGVASIYLWKNATQNLPEDYFNSPRKLIKDVENLLIRLVNPNEQLNPYFYPSNFYSLLCRIKNVVPNISMLMNHSTKLQDTLQDDLKQKEILPQKINTKSRESTIEPINSTSKFLDVIGFDNAKTDLMRYFQSFKVGQSSSLENLGRNSITKGCVLFGPPKFERRALLYAVAGEMKMMLFEISSLFGSFYCNDKQIEDVQDLVKQASNCSPCILFFDNYDCFYDENNDFLSSLIIELDKYEASKGIALILASSRLQNIPRSVNSLTRFGTIVQLVDHLNFNKRKEVFLYHMSNIPIDSKIDVDLIIGATEGMNARQIKYLVGQSALKTKRQNRCKVTTQDVCCTLLMEKLKTPQKITRSTFPHPPVPTRACPPPPIPSPLLALRKKTQKAKMKLSPYKSN